jgi:hypothetical protein
MRAAVQGYGNECSPVRLAIDLRTSLNRPGKIVGFMFEVVFVAAVLSVAIVFPQPTFFQYEVFHT